METLGLQAQGLEPCLDDLWKSATVSFNGQEWKLAISGQDSWPAVMAIAVRKLSFFLAVKLFV